MALKDITITGSIRNHPTLSYGQKTYIASTDEQSFPIEIMTGGAAGTTPDFDGQVATTNLFVNVTQSWAYSIDTPIGEITEIQDTEEEFINGEYSGSALQISDQRLIDEDCIQYLTPSTSSLLYKLYFYNTPTFQVVYATEEDPDAAQTYYDNFLNPITSPNPGEIYLLNAIRQNQSPIPPFSITTTRHIEYIKINRIDGQGVNNTVSLQELDYIRIITSDPSLPPYVTYEVIDISEFSTYYLYQLSLTDQPLNSIPPNTLLLSADSNILDYTLNAVGTVPIVAGQAGIVYINNLQLVSNLSPNSIDLSTGILSSTNTSNIYIQCTASFIANPPPFPPGSQAEGFFAIEDSNGNLFVSGNLAAGSNIFTGSFQLIENTTYRARIFGGGVTSYYVNFFNWIITQSVSPQTSSNSILLEPYLTGDFAYSDCNVLINNATEPLYDSDFFKVNYDNGQIVPSNFPQIIDGTAEPAPVNPSNYTTRAQIYPRYNGVRSNAPNFNEGSDDGTGYGGLVVAGNPAPFIGYYTSKGGSTPEVIGKTIVNLDYIIDEQVNTQVPALSDFTIDSQKSLFPRDGYLYLDPDKNSTGQQFAGVTKYKIYRSGEYATPILYSQTGSNPAPIDELNFVIPGSIPVPNEYNSTLPFYISTTLIQGGSLQFLKYNTIYALNLVSSLQNNARIPLSFFDPNPQTGATSAGFIFPPNPLDYIFGNESSITLGPTTFPQIKEYQFTNPPPPNIQVKAKVTLKVKNIADSAPDLYISPNNGLILKILIYQRDPGVNYTLLDFATLQSSTELASQTLVIKNNQFGVFEFETPLFSPTLGMNVGVAAIVKNLGIINIVDPDNPYFNPGAGSSGFGNNPPPPTSVDSRLFSVTGGTFDIVQYPSPNEAEVFLSQGPYITQVIDSYDLITPEGNSSISFVYFTSSIAEIYAQNLIYPQISSSGYDSTIYPFQFPLDYQMGTDAFLSWGYGGASAFAGSTSLTIPFVGSFTFPPSLPPSGTFDYEIRFNVDESQAYPIIGYYWSGSNFTIAILRNRTASLTSDNAGGTVPSGSYQSFLIRRWIPRAGYIYLDVDAPLGKGVVKPEFTTNDISKKIPQIVKELTDKGLIT